jgi:hypothetical protein
VGRACLASASQKLAGGSEIRVQSNPSGPLIFTFHVFNRVQSVPQRKPARDDEPDENADPKKQTVGRKLDEKKRDHRRGNHQASSAFQSDSHASILANHRCQRKRPAKADQSGAFLPGSGFP